MKPMIIDLGLKPERGYDNQHRWLGEAAGTCVPQRALFGSPAGSKNRSSAEITVLLGAPDTKPRRYV